MWLVLCSANDISAHWAYHGLKQRGLDPLEMVYAEALPFSLSWEHRVSRSGVSVSITLPDGRLIDSGSIRGVINRLIAVPSPRMAHSPDGEYATQEFSALFLSWMYGLPGPVLNRATPQGLCGQWRHISEWVWLASKAGLPAPHYKQSSQDQINEMITERRLFPLGTPTRTVIVVNGRVCSGDVPPLISEGCRRLSELAETSLLGIEFAIELNGEGLDANWIFAGATPMPDLRYGGEELLDQLAAILAESAVEGRSAVEQGLSPSDSRHRPSTGAPA